MVGASIREEAHLTYYQRAATRMYYVTGIILLRASKEKRSVKVERPFRF